MSLTMQQIWSNHEQKLGLVTKYMSGWWYTYPSEKYHSVGIIIPNIWKAIKAMFPTTNQM